MPFNTIWDPGLAGTFGTRADDLGACCAGSGTGLFSNVLGGQLAAGTPAGTNVVNADLSTIINGVQNTINIFSVGIPGDYNLIGNGNDNVVAGNFDTILNGSQNNICGSLSLIGGGSLNCINNNTASSIIGGGTNNAVGTAGVGFLPVNNSFIGGGENNSIASTAGAGSTHNVIVGGSNNMVQAGARSTFIGGGENNCTDSVFSFVGGGAGNCAFDQGSAVVGGLTNIIQGGQSSFIGSGANNLICGGQAGIGSGTGNSIFNVSVDSFIGGGHGNNISSLIPGYIPSDTGFIGGGSANCIDTDNLTVSINNAITGGESNKINPGNTHAYIGGGQANEIATAGSGFASPFSFIGGGQKNAINTNTGGGIFNTIGGGFTNQIFDNSSNTFIGGGTNNSAQGSAVSVGGGQQNSALGNFGTVSGGIGNNIRQGSSSSFIGGGGSNGITGAFDGIASGQGNGIHHFATNSFIGGGYINFIGSPTVVPASNPSNFSFIGGGAFNCIDTNNSTNSCYNAITGGCCNTIQPNSQYGFIGTGECNIASDLGNLVVGGTHNCVNGAYSIIGGGNQNTIDVASAGGPIGTNGVFVGDHNLVTCESIFSGIMAGGRNMIEDGYASFIGGGDWNCISPVGGSYTLYRSFIGGGFQNCIHDINAVIAGGNTNTISAGSANSAILGGTNNTVNGQWSAVLGGSGNTVNHAYAAVFGNGVNSVAPDTFHVSCLNAVNSPLWGGALPAGTLAFVNATPGMVAAGFPAGSKIAMII